MGAISGAYPWVEQGVLVFNKKNEILLGKRTGAHGEFIHGSPGGYLLMRVKFPTDQSIKNCEPHKVIEWQWFNINKLPSDWFLPIRNPVSGKGYGQNLLNT